MAKNDFKLAWRKLLKNKGFTFLNILGLTLGFTGFILSYQYINRETSYDKWNSLQLSWWSFLIPIFCIFMLILFSISFQSIKVAKTNPVDSLRDE
ncbi:MULTISPECIES: hypothetical protein [Sphingobacterium]|uniref:ABC-type antimicrobial peptide transport system permease subunit n=1 Tax=Sphingobacterium zeae TaxID=1776859 RepID=A0ABU0UBF3_9SPHI|nr:MULTISPECIES: hypothetical protein [Sphingobacterium]MDQ1152197.1 ABC-type antimicrobial peptide transport system permease subunit [Sphingobacterium zeae]